MGFEISNHEVEIIDDFEGFYGWVGISSGDLYRDEEVFGYYVAAWYPNTEIELKMLVSAVSEGNCLLTIGARCPRGSVENLTPAELKELPWPNDGVMHSGFISPSEYSTYSRAQEAFEAAQFVVENDNSAKNYVEGKNA